MDPSSKKPPFTTKVNAVPPTADDKFISVVAEDKPLPNITVKSSVFRSRSQGSNNSSLASSFVSNRADDNYINDSIHSAGGSQHGGIADSVHSKPIEPYGSKHVEACNGTAPTDGEESTAPAPKVPIREKLRLQLVSMKKELIHLAIGVAHAKPFTVLAVIILMLLVIAGDAMQVIFLNYWLREYPKDQTAGNYTTFAVSGLVFAFFFIIASFVYWCFRRPSLKFAGYWYGWLLLVGIGTCDTLNSGLVMYAGNRTPEVLEAVFTSVTPIFTAILAKLVLKDPRNYFNLFILIAFIFIVGGIMVASASSFGSSDDSMLQGSNRYWTLLYFLSVPPNVLLNVWQTKYMLEHTEDEKFEEWYLVGHGYPRLAPGEKAVMRAEEHERANGVNGVTSRTASVHSTSPSQAPCREGAPLNDAVSDTNNHFVEASQFKKNNAEYDINGQPNVYYRRAQGDDTMVKLFMLAVDTSVQSIQTLLLMPADAIPWWGGSKTTNESWMNFRNGVHTLFHYKKNFAYCLLYSFGYIFTYIGSAYLNQYSVTLCSMVTQIASPITALILVIFPSINLSDSTTPCYFSVIAVILLIIGSVVYTAWDSMTADEKEDGEFKIKQKYCHPYLLVADKAKMSEMSDTCSVKKIREGETAVVEEDFIIKLN